MQKLVCSFRPLLGRTAPTDFAVWLVDVKEQPGVGVRRMGLDVWSRVPCLWGWAPAAADIFFVADPRSVVELLQSVVYQRLKEG